MSEELQKKINSLIAKHLEPQVPKRRYTPIHGRGTMEVQAPSQLADLDGSRRSGGKVRVSLGQSKPPKRRFNPGDRFEYDGSQWELLFMYRTMREPTVWKHVLAERKPNDTRLIDLVVDALGGGSTTPRIVLTPFAGTWEAEKFFADIPRKGDSIVRTTQQLLAMKRVVTQPQLPA